MSETHEITELLQRWSDGDPRAFSEVIERVDQELKKIAHAYMLSESPNHTLQTTALVNEALIKLMEGRPINWRSRRQFYSLVAIRMRQILIDHARAELAQKRGARAEHIEVDEATQLLGE